MKANIDARVSLPFQPTGRGRIFPCSHCGGLRFQFGNLSTHLDAESFLRLANFVHKAATVLGPKLKENERIVIPFAAGNFSLLVDLEELADLRSLMELGLRWFDDREERVALAVN